LLYVSNSWEVPLTQLGFSLQHGYHSNPTTTNLLYTTNITTNVVIHRHSRKLLVMDILMSETCWAHKKWNKIASDIKLVFYSSASTYTLWLYIVLLVLLYCYPDDDHKSDWKKFVEPSNCGSAVGLPPCRHDPFVYPFIVPCVRLPSVDWLLWGKWTARALPRGFLLGFDFRVRDSSSWFHLFNWWVLSLAGPGAGGSVSSYFLREVYAYVRDMFWGKVLFRSLYFQIEVSVRFCDDLRRLPSVCLGRGWYEFTSP